MKRQLTHSATWRSIAGALLVGLGLFLLFGHVLCAVARLSEVLDQRAGASLEVVSSIMLAASVSPHQLAHAAIALLWPLLIVVAGTALLPDAPVGQAAGCPFIRVLCE